MHTFELFNSIGEPFAAGLFELDASPIIRYSNALKRYWETAKIPDYDGGLLYPCGVCAFKFDESIAFRPHYANTYQLNHKALKEKSEKAYDTVVKEISLVKTFSGHTVGGMGWTHSFPNYARVLKEGLNEYKKRIYALPSGDFKEGMLILLDGIDAYHTRGLSN